ncbi:penicillin-binding protein 1A [Sphingorhabdus sp. M41]|uniref:penicillin-binding protein 1A n=1 Tax=Sphingorhabdus sp. M41 TaxID=1806885 RepID=UPI00078DC37C|nr:PBP1A family penicillin-binding protein [Sphingorhabdus sp. M41]AMO72008.1 penicillin-binding protein [Sphingorhabdus sp. M41]
MVNDASDTAGESLAYKLERSTGSFFERIEKFWQKKWFRLLAAFLALCVLGWFLVWLIFARDLPDATALQTYEPPLPTMVRAYDGEPVHSYARERRVQLEFSEYPALLVRAYLAAEDRTFFEHGGLDYPGIATAILTNISNSGRPVGASTITQQVAKNLLLSSEVSYRRKVREAILAYRIEDVLTKEEILELYLNQIFLGRNAYGVQAAAQAYFGKDVDALALHEIAYLAILPKGPSNYRPEVHEQRAIGRRNWVLGEMRENGWITPAQHQAAIAQPLGTISRSGPRFERVGGYFIEEVRRQLIEQFGENEKAGPYSVYSGGLWVRTSLNPELQEYTKDALRGGLLRYSSGKGWSGPINKIEMDDQWAQRLSSTFIGTDFSNWQIAVAIRTSGGGAEIGFTDGTTGQINSVPGALKAGDIIAVSPLGGSRYRLENVPEVSGGMVVQNPRNGRIWAMQGGFDDRMSSFNRATQAERQPGSTIKPFVYATALEHGMTPATLIADAPFCVYQSASLGRKCFRNFGNSRGAGEKTLRWGVEQSRNLMTVRAANDAGMENVVKTIKTMGIGDYQPYLAFALGAGDTTVMKLTNAYSMLANHGRELKPTVIDFVQNRQGKVIFRADKRTCENCNLRDWDGQPMPRPRPAGKQLMDPMTAYQMVDILQGVITRGTAQNLRSLERPLFGKTGTTSGPTNVWFVGGSPDMVAGVYLGYDQPRNMGGYAQGGTLAAPIFRRFAEKAMAGMPKTPFVAPKGVRMVRVDRRSGKRVYGGWPTDDPKSAVIWDVFKPETEPRRSIRKDELLARLEARKAQLIAERAAALAAAREANRNKGPAQNDDEFLQAEGGIY